MDTSAIGDLMFRAVAVHSVTISICSLINTIQAPGNTSPQRLLSVLKTKDGCVWMVNVCGLCLCWHQMAQGRSELLKRSKEKNQLQLSGYFHSKSMNTIDPCVNDRSLASRTSCQILFACFLAPLFNLILPIATHGSWGAFHDIKQVMLLLSLCVWSPRYKMHEMWVTFYKEKSEAKRYIVLLTLIKHIRGRTAVLNSFCQDSLSPPQLKAPQSI